MYTSDKKLIELIELLVYQKKYKSIRSFCIENEILEQTVSKIKAGTNHFTVLQIENICKKYNVNFNWVFGLSKEMYNKTENKKVNKN